MASPSSEHLSTEGSAHSCDPCIPAKPVRGGLVEVGPHVTDASDLTWSIPISFVDAIARRVATIVIAETNRTTTVTPYMTVPEAADYLRWPKERIYKLTAANAIPHIHHEGRILLRRDELDMWLAEFREGPRPRER